MKSKKIKYSVEFNFPQTATNILWSNISTPRGLENWFADSVQNQDNEWTFTWDKTTQKAHCVSNRANTLIKFRWNNDSKDHYFEFKLFENELVHITTLIITDFALEEELDTDKQLWESQISILKHNLGI